ncbi:MAG: 8-oxoguanine deaminase [Deltaproteobacteria bacterium]|nr:8-oxoguanine deaminase [Deltaproteobacteria bacterium]
MDDRQQEIANGAIVVEDRAIAQVGRGPFAGPFDREIDATGCVALPGFINTHHHLYQTMQRAVPFVQDAKLFDWLVGLYEIWRELTAEAVHASALVGISELLLSGCTTVADHFYVFPHQQKSALLDETIRAARRLGARFHPTRGSMSLGRSQGGLPPDDVVQCQEEICADCERVIAEHHDPGRFSMCRLALAPCSPFSVTAEELRRAADLARKLGVRLHTHLAETRDEERFCLEQRGVRPLGYMEQVGWVGGDVWYAHGVHFDDAELDLLARTGTGVAHCPSSNLRLGSGIARVPAMLERGVPVGLAVDGSASNDGSNLLQEIRLACLVHRVGTGVEAMPARSALWLATRGSARVLGRDDIGQLTPGMAADIALFDLRDLAYAGAMHDPVAALVMCQGPARARFVLVNGEVVVDDGGLPGLDVPALIDEQNRLAAEMIARMRQRTGIDPLRHRTVAPTHC